MAATSEAPERGGGAALLEYPGRPRRLGSLLSVAAGGILLAALALASAYIAGHLAPGPVDRWGLHVVPPQYHSGPLEAVADLGNPVVVAAVAALAAGSLLLRGDRRRAVACIAGPVLAGVIDLVTKPAVGRTIGGALCFPSGHAAGAAALGAVVVLATAARWRFVAALLALAVGTGASAAVVALGWHYPTDALAGLGLGWGAVALVGGLVQLLVPPPRVR